MKLQVITILVCICAVSAYDIYKRKVRATSRAFNVSVEKIESCFNKANVTLADLSVLSDSLDDPNQEVENGESEMRATCGAVCIAQEKGLMRGSKLQMDKLHDAIDKEQGTIDIKNSIHDAVDACADRGKRISTRYGQLLANKNYN